MIQDAPSDSIRTVEGPDLLEIKNLKMHFPISRGGLFRREQRVVRAVDGVDLSVKARETVGVVGESGCGKSTMARAIIRLYRPTAGSVKFDGLELTTMTDSEMRAMRRRMQMVFQDPYASLNPRMTIERIVSEPLEVHRWSARSGVARRTAELLEVVGLNANFKDRYPHEFSGGQRQRIGIARALAVQPELIVADEPVSALDVSIQAQIINLLEKLQDDFGLTFLFIAHDLSVVRHISNRIVVMYLGRVVELADRIDLYEQPLHPYTQALLSAVPIPDPPAERNRRRIVLSGDVPSPVDPPSGCRFHPRCPLRDKLGSPAVCQEQEPELRALGKNHWAACHFAGE